MPKGRGRLSGPGRRRGRPTGDGHVPLSAPEPNDQNEDSSRDTRSSVGPIPIPMFDQDDYPSWKFDMELFLTGLSAGEPLTMCPMDGLHSMKRRETQSE